MQRHLSLQAFGQAVLARLLAVVTGASVQGAEPALPAFTRMTVLEAQGETSAGVSIGDLNADGMPDIILAKGRHWPLHNRVLLNAGQRRFSAANLGDSPDRTYSAALADLDGNGTLDVVVSNDRPDQKLIYLNDGRGHFRVAGTFGEPGWTTRYVTLADLNGDGFPDIVAANRGGGAPNRSAPSYVCFNDGRGNFGPGQTLATESATIIVCADLDNDGAADLIVPHRDGGQSVIWWNSGKGTFADSTPLGPASSQIRAAAAGDLNGDGRPDLVFGDEKAARVAIHLNSGGRAFAPEHTLATGAKPYAIAVADLNGDGKTDVVVGNAGGRGAVFFNEGDGRKFRSIPWNDGQGSVYAVAVADLDRDGWPDLVAARSDAPNAIWFGERPGDPPP